MGNLRLVLTIVSSLFFASALSSVFTPLVIPALPNLFSTDIPGVTDTLAYEKTYDIVRFILFLVFSFILSFVNFKLLPKIKSEGIFPYIFMVVGAVLLFIQANFIQFSKTQLIIEFLGIFVAFWFLQTKLFITRQAVDFLKEENKLFLFNSLFLGFFALIFIKQFAVTPAFISFFLIPLILVGISNSKIGIYLKNYIQVFPGFLLILAAFYPDSSLNLALIFIFTLILSLVLYFLNRNLLEKPLFLNVLYPSFLIFLSLYNPNFFTGNYDSVEEGFFLGWQQRLIEGQVMYKDFLAYHPPFFTWLLFGFSKIVGFSIFSERLFLHLLQIVGLIIYYFVTKKVMKNWWVILMTLILVFSFSNTLVRNNVEIRLGLGLLAFLPFFSYLKTQSTKMLLISGIFASFSIFSSIEVGVGTVFALFISLLLFSQKRLQSFTHLGLGLLLGSLPFLFILLFQGAFIPFIEQMKFYTQAFSQGYFNTPVERSLNLAFFYWHIVNQYLSSNAFLWTIAEFTIIGTFVYLLLKRFFQNKFSLQEKYIFSLVIFALVLFRSALGRSDLHHLLFVLFIAFIITGFLIERLDKYSRTSAVVCAIFLLFVFVRPQVNAAFLNDQFFKIQTYGQVLGDYKSYSFERSGKILVGLEIDTDSTSKLVDKIQKETTPEDLIFAYPWMPELYFYTNRKNATSVDTPYAFFTEKYQDQMISELKENKPKYIIYLPEMNFGGLSGGSLPKIQEYIFNNYQIEESFGKYQVMVPR